MGHATDLSKLVHEGVARTIVRMAIPLLAGTFAMTMYQVTNAWFVSRLGTEPLAAISFTFPIVMLLLFVTRGLSGGAMTLVGHAIGEKNHKKAATLTTHALVFALLFGALISVLGLCTITPVFSALGASGDVLDLTARYMRIWYLGAVIAVLQVVIVDIIISTGSTKVVSLLMVGSTVLNVFLDMGFIFGMFGMPRMGIAGAATATVISQAAAATAAFSLLAVKMRLIDTSVLRPKAVLKSWGMLLRFAVPGSLGMIMTPISHSVVTRLAAGYGNAAVAAIGVSVRLEIFAFMIPMTVGISLIPFIAQNYGAQRMDRIRKARKGAMTFAACYGVLIGLFLIAFAKPIAQVFSEDPAVVEALSSYICITSMGYGMMEVHRYAGFTMTGCFRPFQGSMLAVVRVVGFLIPLSIAGSIFFQLTGIFWARLLTDILAGLVGIWWSGKILSGAR